MNKQENLNNIKENFYRNIKRISSLLKIYDNIATKVQGRKGITETDILRASIVMLHASLEEVMRGFAVIFWIEKDSDFINKRVPFYDPENNTKKSADKYNLGDLCKLDRNMTIQDLLQKSVDNYIYSKFTINDVKQLNSEIENIFGKDFIDTLKLLDPHQNIEVGTPKRGKKRKVCLHTELENFFTRRHRIVHHADINSINGQGNHTARSINKDLPKKWKECIEFIVTSLFNEAAKRLIPQSSSNTTS